MSIDKILAFIAKCENPKELKIIIKNAKAKADNGVAGAAFKRLVGLVPSEKPGTIEYDFWRSINAFELLLSDERGKTIRLTRTRQKIAKVGIFQTLQDLTLSSKPSRGFSMLLERQMPELTAEAVVLRHCQTFADNVVAAARDRLVKANVDVGRL